MQKSGVLTLSASLLWAILLLAGGLLTGQPARALPPSRPLHSPGDCVVTTTLDSGAGSLRQCMAGLQPEAMLTFSPTVFPSDRPVTITLTSPLPHLITSNVTINAGNAEVILWGAETPDGTAGLVIDGADGVVIQGLRILHFPGAGIWLQNGAANNLIGGINSTPTSGCSGDCNLISGNGDDAIGLIDPGTTANTISGNYIGVNAAGTAMQGNLGCGVWLGNGASYNLIGGDTSGEGNLISGNASDGISLNHSGTVGNIISGNYIGTNADGTVALGNEKGGILLGEAGYTLVGGSVPGKRNLVSGNAGSGITILGSGAVSNTVSGNYIGTNAAGTAALGNLIDGVWLGNEAGYNHIGGLAPGEGNLISGNSNNGINMGHHPGGNSVSYNTISGNIIGADIGGETAVPNGRSGIFISAGSYNLIGGNTAAERNLISGNTGGGITLSGSETVSNTISGNYIGVNAAGTAALGNLIDGVWLGDETGYNRIGGDAPGEGNLISGNSNGGIVLHHNPGGAGVRYNTISGNIIGADISGETAVPNGKTGIFIGGGSYNLIGGSTTAERNLISGNGTDGVRIAEAEALSNTVSGNYVGVNVTGLAALANGGDGIRLEQDTQYNVVGGNASGERNVVSGNTTSGVSVGDGAAYNMVSGNIIGADATGTVALPNGTDDNPQAGVALYNGAHHNRVGGDATAQRNVIGGNKAMGVAISGNGTDNNTISGNLIGLAGDGSGVLGNAFTGILLAGNARNNLIGGNTVAQGNVIAYNAGYGIFATADNTVYNTFSHNSIYSNGAAEKAGIHLAKGANLALFPPILTNVSSTTVAGVASPYSIVEIFSDDEDQGRYFHGAVVADASGDFNFSQTQPFTGVNVTATATDSDGNTSEFSAAYMPKVDAQVVAILQPKAFGKTGQSITPTVKIGNAGTTIETAALTVTITGPGGLNYTGVDAAVELLPLGYATLTFNAFTPGVVGNYYFTATVALPGDQENANDVKTVTLTVGSDLIDLWTRDSLSDVGDIPTRNFWQSPDIWVRHTCDGGITHQDPIAGQPNCVYLIVRNRGNAPSANATARVYWHTPSLGIQCGNWTPVGSAQPIPTVLPHNGTHLLAFTWTPDHTGHTCLHGEIVSVDDPVINACDIPWDNNLSQRNVDIIAGEAGLNRLQAKGGIVFELANIKNKPKPVSVIADVSQIPDAGAVRLVLGSELMARWANGTGPAQSSGISWDGGDVITVTHAVSGTIAAIPFEAGEVQTVTLLVSAPSIETATVSIYEAIDGGPGVSLADAIVGGNTYIFNTETKLVYLPLIVKQ